MMSTVQQPTSTLSLKEWAVAVKALSEGKQIITIRKGGLHEETREFVLERDTFYLYPTYEHQKPEMVKPEYHGDLNATLTEWAPDKNKVAIRCFAHVTDDVELMDEAKLRALFPYHIWTENFADVRLHWKRTKPLHILFLRVYRLERPFELEVADAYKGCKSWHHLLQSVPESPFSPVLSDEEYQAKRAEIMNILRG